MSAVPFYETTAEESAPPASGMAFYACLKGYPDSKPIEIRSQPFVTTASSSGMKVIQLRGVPIVDAMVARRLPATSSVATYQSFSVNYRSEQT